MLAYAASRPRIAERRSNPHALLAVVAVHVALAAVVMSAKMELPPKVKPSIVVVDLIPNKQPPPEHVVRQNPRPLLQPNHLWTPPEAQPTLPSDSEFSDATPVLPGPDPSVMPGPLPGPTVIPTPRPAPVATSPRLLTPPSELRPPYPPSKLLTEEEALLKLRLTIDERGRVRAVEALGPADRVFLEAARRYLIAHWRYTPATDGVRAVASSTVITLKFQLDG